MVHLHNGTQTVPNGHTTPSKSPADVSYINRPEGTPSRAEETKSLLTSVLSQLTTFLSKADSELDSHKSHSILPQQGSSIVSRESLNPNTLQSILSSPNSAALTLSSNGTGPEGLLTTLTTILKYSVNPSSPGFLDKLYAAPLPPGIAADLILSFLNTNLHVYQVSPVLTLIEKHVTTVLARELFHFTSPRAGGISVQGGSASNLTSIVVARNSLYPDTKIHGNFHAGRELVLLTSAHGHYSIEKAAQALGFGSAAVIPVPVDSLGRMIPSSLESLIRSAKEAGKTPFYVNATAGSTVLGSFDPFPEIRQICNRHRIWMHVDGAWGGSFCFSSRPEVQALLIGTELADSLAINPHKMLGVPVTCSFLLGKDMRLFEQAMTLKAGYLFHEADEDEDDENERAGEDDETRVIKDHNPNIDRNNINTETNAEPDLYSLSDTPDPTWTSPNDLADITLQCGRRGDSLKFHLAWQYYGTKGYAALVETAYFQTALHLNSLVDNHPDLTLVLGKGSKPSCLQVCFYYTPGGKFAFGLHNDNNGESKSVLKAPLPRANKSSSDITTAAHQNTNLNTTTTTEQEITNVKKHLGKFNTILTRRITNALIERGFMIDFAPALDGQEDRGSFFRVVVNISTVTETVERLVCDVVDVGGTVLRGLVASRKYGGVVER